MAFRSLVASSVMCFLVRSLMARCLLALPLGHILTSAPLSLGVAAVFISPAAIAYLVLVQVMRTRDFSRRADLIIE